MVSRDKVGDSGSPSHSFVEIRSIQCSDECGKLEVGYGGLQNIVRCFKEVRDKIDDGISALNCNASVSFL